jgi:Acetyltransferase (GNAT) domain
MNFYELDPTLDPRWERFINSRLEASIFHTRGWLTALQKTYGYQPIGYTTSPPHLELKGALVLCKIESWLTGKRLVALPFSDHCELLCETQREADLLIGHLRSKLEDHNWRYLELRPIKKSFDQNARGFQPTAQYFLHRIDLSPSLAEILKSFDKDSVQRRILRAERADLKERQGNSVDLIEEFYRIFMITRRRHRLPPMPLAWFNNLVECLGDALRIRIAYKSERAVAAILTLRFKGVSYYKYGCSDVQFNALGAMPWLLWKAIEAAKEDSAIQFDMGRTEVVNAGLTRFKNHWVKHPECLTYWGLPDRRIIGPVRGWKLKVAKHVFARLPDPLLTLTGRLLYRHIG